jgi:hypothetical protein
MIMASETLQQNYQPFSSQTPLKWPACKKQNCLRHLKNPLFLTLHLCKKIIKLELGLAIPIHHSISLTHLNTSTLSVDPSLKILAVSIDIGSSTLDIVNIYLPPISSCPSSHRPDFASLLDLPSNDALILGDLHTHHSSWFSPRDPGNPQGNLLASILEPSIFCILNSD